MMCVKYRGNHTCPYESVTLDVVAVVGYHFYILYSNPFYSNSSKYRHVGVFVSHSAGLN